MNRSTPDAAPWNGHLADRLSVLRRSPFRVLYFYEHPDSASFRYRCYNMAQAINIAGSDVAATYIFLSDLEALKDPGEIADVLVISRTRYDSRVERLISSFSSKGKKTFFDIDDLIFDIQFTSLVAASLDFPLWGEGIDKWFSLISRMGTTMTLCDHVIVTNDFLAEKAREFSQKPASVVPNFLNREQIEVSTSLADHKLKDETPDDSVQSAGSRLILGYFSGSKSHKKDFDVVAGALRSVLESHPMTELLVVGHLPMDAGFNKFGNRLIRREFTDFLSLQELIASVDLCLSPLQMSAFTFSKSQLKFFEAGAVAVPTAASPTPVFQASIQHGQDGYLVKAGEWEGFLNDFIESDRSERLSVSRQAFESSMGRYTPAMQSKRILEVVTQN